MILGSYLEKFKKIIDSNFLDKEKIILTIRNTTKIDIKTDQIEIKNRILKIKKLNSQEKSEIFLNKAKILSQVDNNKIKDIAVN